MAAKMLAGALDFGRFDFAEFHGAHGALGFGNKIHVLDFALVEGYCPVGIILANGRIDEESLGQLDVKRYFLTRFQFLCEVEFVTGIINQMVV